MSRGGRVFIVALMFVLGLSAVLVALSIAPKSAASPPATTVKVKAPPRSTTTIDPYAQLRASLNDYCGAKGRGHALITVHHGAPLGSCSGR